MNKPRGGITLLLEAGGLLAHTGWRSGLAGLSERAHFKKRWPGANQIWIQKFCPALRRRDIWWPNFELGTIF